MQRDENTAIVVVKWLRFAKSDLAYASLPLPADGLYEQACFHAQQAVEKSIKAVLISQYITFPFTHNLQKLVELLPEPLRADPLFIEATRLTDYAVLTRYPGEAESITDYEYQQAVQIASKIVQYVEDWLTKNMEEFSSN